nr:Chain D, Mu-conotoxin KIIIA [Conus kinoshitai]
CCNCSSKWCRDHSRCC